MTKKKHKKQKTGKCQGYTQGQRGLFFRSTSFTENLPKALLSILPQTGNILLNMGCPLRGLGPKSYLVMLVNTEAWRCWLLLGMLWGLVGVGSRPCALRDEDLGEGSWQPGWEPAGHSGWRSRCLDRLAELFCERWVRVQPHPGFHDPRDCSPPGSSVHGTFQARILEWVTISFSRGSSQPRDRTRISCVSCMAGGFFTTEAPRKP